MGTTRFPHLRKMRRKKNPKYNPKEPVIRFTHHCSHAPFCLASNIVCGALRGTAKMNQRLLCFIFVARISPSLSMTCVHENRIIDPKIVIIDMKQAFFPSL